MFSIFIDVAGFPETIKISILLRKIHREKKSNLSSKKVEYIEIKVELVEIKIEKLVQFIFTWPFSASAVQSIKIKKSKMSR